LRLKRKARKEGKLYLAIVAVADAANEELELLFVGDRGHLG